MVRCFFVFLKQHEASEICPTHNFTKIQDRPTPSLIMPLGWNMAWWDDGYQHFCFWIHWVDCWGLFWCKILLWGNRATPMTKRGKILYKIVVTKHGKMGIKIHLFDTENRLQKSILHEAMSCIITIKLVPCYINNIPY